MVEGVLGDVGDAEIRVLPDSAGRGFELAGEQLDGSRLAGAVGPDDGDTGGERALEGDVRQLGLGGAGVLEGDIAHLEDSLLLGLDALEEAGFREGEGDLGGAELIVRLGLGDLLNELGEITLVTTELE
ncbi:hypothetical protein BC936DRAFT_144573 [Jimgerdemannia flammicorona]|uniref:Uncharacterized protein n=1 Tax=Jimgerdemannia flammicorona TaxID=994334 RepID=A0A433DC68_9FUNG|nr:hypothetical protein BC936DRAFT_144573 [Jimgerdemannia flammicorona]